MARLDLVSLLVDHAARGIDTDGLRPLPAYWLDRGGRLAMAALLLKPGQIIDLAWDRVRRRGDRAMAWALDRHARPGQGTTLDSLLTIADWSRGSWRIGVLEYQHEPRVIKPVRWDNDYWRMQAGLEIAARQPGRWPRSRGARWERRWEASLGPAGREALRHWPGPRVQRANWLAMGWLSRRLTKLGATPRQRERQCFAAGQLTSQAQLAVRWERGGVDGNPWAVARMVAAEFRAGRPFRPGPGLAHALSSGVLRSDAVSLDEMKAKVRELGYTEYL
jgi:hypothetical protein